jgi:hypothetical protein
VIVRVSSPHPMSASLIGHPSSCQAGEANCCGAPPMSQLGQKRK